jgi:hypothetical protein
MDVKQSLTVGEEHRLRVFENKVLKKNILNEKGGRLRKIAK